MTDLPANLKNNPLLDRWIGLDDGGLVIRSGKVELGQGIATAMAVIAASELRVDPRNLRVGVTDTRHAPNEGYTAGSFSIEHGGPAMRVAAAMTRDLFTAAAARHLGAEADDLVITDGLFQMPGQNASVSYGELAAAVDLNVSALDLPFPRLLGLDDSAHGLRRPDLEAKLSGAAYIQDMRLPGMCFGRILRPAAPNLRLVDFDRARVAALPGVVAVVIEGSFAGVVARRDEQALAAIAVARKTARWAPITDLPADDDALSWMDGIAVPPPHRDRSDRPRSRRAQPDRPLPAPLPAARLRRPDLRRGRLAGRWPDRLQPFAGHLSAAGADGPRPEHASGKPDRDPRPWCGLLWP